MKDAQNVEMSQAIGVVERLPESNYALNYQPHYTDHGALIGAVHELQSTVPVTTPRQIDSLQAALTGIAEGRTGLPVVISGNCHEPVNVETPISELVSNSISIINVITASDLGNAIKISRDRGQNAKPRSKQYECAEDGSKVVSFMGEAVNSKNVADRVPDPTRMVAAAVQSRDIETGLQEYFGHHVPAAHEALLLPYEMSFIKEDEQTGKKYLLSADLPWVGVRTNAPDGAHVDMLSGVANPVGVKLGPDTAPRQVSALAEKLNPGKVPGRLILMPRYGLSNIGKLIPVLEAIKSEAPETLVIYDMHGSTKSTPNGTKIRLVSDIIDEIRAVANLCGGAGLRLNGLHLETMTDDSRLECIDEPSQVPTHPGNVDPQLNPRQTRHVLDSVAPYIQ